jgi:plastocyanin
MADTPTSPRRVRIRLARNRRAGLVLAALVAAVALSACGGGSPSASGSGGVSGTHLTISNFTFSPSTLVVSPGQTVTVTNNDSVTHTVTSTASPPAFDTGNVGPNHTGSFKAPTQAGTYAYICSIHPFMTGTLRVR